MCDSLPGIMIWLVSIVAVRKSPKLLAVVRFHHESPKNLGCWYSWEHSGFASLSPRFEPWTVHQIGEREALVTSGDCKSSTLRYTGFESLALHHLTYNDRLCIIHENRNNALVAERSNAWDCKSQKSLVQIQPSVPNVPASLDTLVPEDEKCDDTYGRF